MSNLVLGIGEDKDALCYLLQLSRVQTPLVYHCQITTVTCWLWLFIHSNKGEENMFDLIVCEFHFFNPLMYTNVLPVLMLNFNNYHCFYWTGRKLWRTVRIISLRMWWREWKKEARVRQLSRGLCVAHTCSFVRRRGSLNSFVKFCCCEIKEHTRK